MVARSTFMQTTMLAGMVGAVFLSAPDAAAADMIAKAPYDKLATTPAPAVDGFNGKVDAFGGSFANRGLYGGKGSFSVPLGGQFGAQLDGAVGSFDSRAFGAVAGHMFWRDPSRALAGLYVSHTHWDRFGGVHVTQVGAEGEYYFGQWTLQGVVGVEFGNTASSSTLTTSTIPGGGTATSTYTEFYDVRTRFFDQINLAYYVQPDWKVFVGHRYLGGKNALAAGTEWSMPLGGGRMASLFVEGRVGERDFHGVWGGLKVYFGQSDKPLIARHRQDDPINWSPDSLFSIVNSFGSSGSTVGTCPFPEVLVNGVCVFGGGG